MKPAFPQVETGMQEGYTALERGDTAACAALWLDTWKVVAGLARERGLETLSAFDDAFRGSQYVYNWVQDLDEVLLEAGHTDPRFWEEGIRHVEEFLQAFPEEDDLLVENARRHVAELHSLLGRRDESDRLYRSWLDADPRWGWGWIGWADTHYFVAGGSPFQEERAEALLLEGLAVPDVRDRADILDRLATVYEETGREERAGELRRQIAELTKRGPAGVTVSEDPVTGSRKVSFEFGEDGPPLEQLGDIAARAREILGERPRAGGRKVGRNEPCPCGSGRKFKKCCGR